jgi:hypothetical protein
MRKRTVALLAAGSLIASIMAIGPASAQDAPAPAIPAEPNIADPIGDANFVNGSMIHPAVGNNHETGQDASSIGDLVAVWFTTAQDKISAHVQVELPPPGGNGVSYNVFASPGEGPAGANTVGCIRFWLVLPGTNPGGGSFQGPPVAKLHDRCNTGGNIWDSPDVEYSLATAEDGTGVVTITAPRDLSPLFAEGSVLVGPTATSASPTAGTTGSALTPTVDNTDPGLDYTVATGGGAEEPPVGEEPPGEEPPSGGETPNPEEPKKDCKGKKGKAKKKCKKNAGKPDPKPAACDAYVPGETGAEAESLVVEDVHTSETPLEHTLATSPGVGAGRDPAGEGMFVSHAYLNLQVDSASETAGLWVRVSFPEVEDYDLYLDFADGTNAASAGGFGPIADGNESDSESAVGSETIIGVKTSDCGGYTLDVAGATTAGGDVTVTTWLGEQLWDPVAQAAVAP